MNESLFTIHDNTGSAIIGAKLVRSTAQSAWDFPAAAAARGAPGRTAAD